MTHDVREPMERNRLSHPVAKAGTQIVRTPISELGMRSVFFDQVAQHAL